MDTVEKNLLIGAVATGVIDAALEGYFAYVSYGLGQNLKNQFPYQDISPYLPSTNELIACAVFPAGLYFLGKAMKKESMVQMAKGGAIYGGPELIGITLYRTVHQTAPLSLRASARAQYYQIR